MIFDHVCIKLLVTPYGKLYTPTIHHLKKKLLKILPPLLFPCVLKILNFFKTKKHKKKGFFFFFFFLCFLFTVFVFIN